RTERAAWLLLRLHWDRRRGARPLQPVRGLSRRLPDRWPREWGLHAPKRRVSVRARRCTEGPDPLLRARRRAAHPLSPPLRPRPPPAGRDGSRGDAMTGLVAAGVNDGFLVVVLAAAVIYGTPLVYAALGELLAER